MELLKMQNLPLELLFQQAVQLDLPALNALCQTNQYLYRVLCDNNEFWKYKFKHDFGEISADSIENYKTYYQQYCNLWIFNENTTSKEYQIKPLQISIGTTQLGLIDIYNQLWCMNKGRLVPKNIKAKYVAAGNSLIMIIDLNNQVWSFNHNPIALNLYASQISLSPSEHGLAISTNAQVYAWGKNQWGQANPNSTETHITQPQALNLTATKVATGVFFSVCIDTQAQLWIWGYNALLGLRNLPLQISPTIIATEVKDVAVGSAHILIVDLQNNVWVIGSNRAGQLGLGDLVHRDVWISLNMQAQQISAAGAKSMLIDLANNVYAWGSNRAHSLKISSTRITVPTVIPQFKAYQIEAGIYQSALAATGE